MASPMRVPAAALHEFVTVVLAVALLVVLSVEWWRRRRGRTALMRALVERSGDAIAVLGRDGRLRTVAGAVQAVLGRRLETLRGRRLSELVHGDDADGLVALASDLPPRELSLRVRHPGGFWLPLVVSVADLRDDRAVRGLVLRMRDASEQRELESQLRERALHDPLTGLPNRALFLDRIEQALQRPRRHEELVSVAFVDLDDFKAINDTLGHAAGDELLVGVAERLRSTLRGVDTAARLGGDEFAVLLHGLPEHSEVVRVAERMLDRLSEPHELGGETRHALPSIGVSIAGDGVTADDLVRQADAAMYAAKRAGKGRYELYVRPAEEEVVAARPGEQAVPGWMLQAEQQRDAVAALLEAPIRPLLAPIVDLRTGVLAGHEALPDFATAHDRPPAAWLAQARRCGLGPRLEAEVLRSALALPARPDGTFLALNLPAYALDADELQEVLPADLAGIVIEVDEGSLLAAGEGLDIGITRLRHRGARLAVDGAGAGYGALRMLMRVRPDVVKLERGLVQDVAEDGAAQTLVDSFVRLARTFGAEVCAEGVEDAEDLRVLARLEVRYAQGRAVGAPGAAWSRPSAHASMALRHGPAAGARGRRASTAPPGSTAPPETAPRPSR
jgi:diguanylate cyclase (GGDEF)-like protein/PAS domain S-box-containing protein